MQDMSANPYVPYTAPAHMYLILAWGAALDYIPREHLLSPGHPLMMALWGWPRHSLTNHAEKHLSMWAVRVHFGHAVCRNQLSTSSSLWQIQWYEFIMQWLRPIKSLFFDNMLSFSSDINWTWGTHCHCITITSSHFFLFKVCSYWIPPSLNGLICVSSSGRRLTVRHTDPPWNPHI